ncbi:hypothetical protein D3C80_1616750 [compost metagenome]
MRGLFQRAVLRHHTSRTGGDKRTPYMSILAKLCIHHPRQQLRQFMQQITVFGQSALTHQSFVITQPLHLWRKKVGHIVAVTQRVTPTLLEGRRQISQR